MVIQNFSGIALSIQPFCNKFNASVCSLLILNPTNSACATCIGIVNTAEEITSATINLIMKNPSHFFMNDSYILILLSNMNLLQLFTVGAAK